MLEINKIHQGDCMDLIKEIKDNSINLVVTDPPYNIGWKYKAYNDNRKDYIEWCIKWCIEIIPKLKSNGIICLINYPENNNLIYQRLLNFFKFVQQLVWCYNTNIGHSKRKYTRSYRTILVLSKGDNYTFNPILQEYKNPTDPRIKERISNGSKGVTHYDVLNINLCKNVSKSKKNNGINQLPDKLVNFLIKSYSNKGDLILDPFVGNGTVFNQSIYLKRNSIGIDINKYQEVSVNSSQG